MKALNESSLMRAPDSPRMKALVTGFEPFGDDPINPALEALHLLPRAARTCRDRDLDPADRVRPSARRARRRADGDPSRSRAVRRAGRRAGRACRWNGWRSISTTPRIPDNAGRQPIDRAIVPGGPAAYFATCRSRRRSRRCAGPGFPRSCRTRPARFVCNHVFYGLMHRAATAAPRLRGGFLHVPYLPAQAARNADSVPARRRWRSPTSSAASRSCSPSPRRAAKTSPRAKAPSADAARDARAGVLSPARFAATGLPATEGCDGRL